MADLPTIADMRLRFPEFTEEVVSDSVVQFYLNDTASFLDENSLGSCYKIAASYYTAHLIALSIRTTEQAQSSSSGVPGVPSSGTVSSSSAGDLSVSFSSAVSKSNTEDWYKSTSYGQHFLSIVESCVSGVDIAGSPGYTYVGF
jgi:hypothetical protein